jgi:hypothetical protein
MLLQKLSSPNTFILMGVVWSMLDVACQ